MKTVKETSSKLTEILNSLTIPSLDELANAGVLYGEEKNKTHPKMIPYIYKTDKDEKLNQELWVINLEETAKKLQEACDFVFKLASKGNLVLFLGTKESCKELIKNSAELAGMPFLNNKWIPGLLTNFNCVIKPIAQQKDSIEKILTGVNKTSTTTKKEKVVLRRKLDRIRNMYNGIESMYALPSALVLIGGNEEKNAIEEAKKLNIPIIGLFDTDCNPDGIKYIIPGNDDSRNSVKIILDTLTKYIVAGIQYYASTKRIFGTNSFKDNKYGNSNNYYGKNNSNYQGKHDSQYGFKKYSTSKPPYFSKQDNKKPEQIEQKKPELKNIVE